MKHPNKILLPALAILVMLTAVTSCFKKFDPADYSPPLSIGGFTSTKEIAPANLIAYFAFDGSLVDSVSNTAGVNTGTGFAAGFKKQGLQGANNSYVTFTPTPAILSMQSFTITYWVNSPVNTSGIVGLVNLSNNNNFWGNIDMFFENGSTATAGKFRAHITNGSKEAWIAKDGLPNLFNAWTNFALSYDAATTTFKLYVNGSVVHTVVEPTFGPIAFTNSGKIVFGTVHFQTTPSLTTATGSQPWASYLTGMLDEVRIYNKALSENEVNSLVKLEGRGK